jgi:hypothetical protein
MGEQYVGWPKEFRRIVTRFEKPRGQLSWHAVAGNGPSILRTIFF